MLVINYSRDSEVSGAGFWPGSACIFGIQLSRD